MSRRKEMFVVGLLAVVLVVWLTPAVAPNAARRLGLRPADPWSQSRRLDSELEEAARRIHTADALAGALAEGRVSLADAASTLLVIHEDMPQYRERLQTFYAGATDLERAARQAAERAHDHVSDAADRDRLAARLAAEFRTLFPSAEPLRSPVPVPVTVPVIIPAAVPTTAPAAAGPRPTFGRLPTPMDVQATPPR